MIILLLHGWHSVPGGIKPIFLIDNGHTVINLALNDDDFATAVATAQAESDQYQPDVVVGSSRGGAVAMNIESGNARLVLLCPAWKNWGSAKGVKPGTVILHSRADDVIPFTDSEKLATISGATLIEVGNDHRLADQEPLPLVVIDVYEHAFYIDYQNKKADYIEKFMQHVDRAEANHRFLTTS